MIQIGFTGTRKGMTPAQLATVDLLLSSYAAKEKVHHFHHGDCFGADDEADTIARQMGYIMHLYPSNGSLRANCHLKQTVPLVSSYIDFPGHTLDRNRAIVDACEVLIAAPREAVEAPRGGTWFTVRYARSKGLHVLLCLPDGTVVDSKAQVKDQLTLF